MAARGKFQKLAANLLEETGQPEFAIGAIDESGNAYLTKWATDLPAQVLQEEQQRQLEVLRRRRAQYTPFYPALDPRGRIAIVVDDGIATGSTMIAALRAVRARKPRKLVCAVAVASPEAARSIACEADATVCLTVPADFFAVGQFFDDFAQVTDQEVVSILRQSRENASAPGRRVTS